MSFIITTSIRNFNYYIKITYEGARYPDFKFEGLIDNATKFPTKELAEDAIRLVSPRTKNVLSAIPKK